MGFDIWIKYRGFFVGIDLVVVCFFFLLYKIIKYIIKIVSKLYNFIFYFKYSRIYSKILRMGVFYLF